MDEDVDRLHIKVEDVKSTNLLEFLEIAHAFIDEALQRPQGRVLVHCFAGRSRSVSVVQAYTSRKADSTFQVVVSYLMKKKNLSAANALKYMDERYPHACPNTGVAYCLGQANFMFAGFLEQLQVFEESGNDYARALAEYEKQRKPQTDRRDAEPLKITRYYGDKDTPEPKDQKV